LASGFFLVKICGLFKSIHSKNIKDFDVVISKEGILDNMWNDSNIFDQDVSMEQDALN
jgi:hypothetical protein